MGSRKKPSPESILKPLDAQAYYRTLFHALGDPVFIFDQETHRFLDCNQAALDCYGYSLEELQQMTPLDLHPPEDLEMVRQRLNDSSPSPNIYTHLTKDGRRIEVEIHTESLELEGRQAWISCVRDLAARRHDQESLAQRDAILEALSTSAGQFLIQTDPMDEITALLRRLGNAARLQRVFVYQNSETKDGMRATLLHEWYRSQIKPLAEIPSLVEVDFSDPGFDTWRQYFNRGGVYSGGREIIPERMHPDIHGQGLDALIMVPIHVSGVWWGHIGFSDGEKERRWSIVEVEALKTSAAMIGAVLTRQNDRMELIESERRYHSLFENTPIFQSEQDFSEIKKLLDGILAEGVADMRAYLRAYPEVVDECMRRLKLNAINSRSVSFYGAETKDDLMNHLNAIMRDDTRELFTEELVAISEGRIHFEMDGINYKLTGEPLNIRLYWAVLPGYEDTMARVVVSIIDMTETKKLEAQLRKSEEMFRSIIEQSSDGIMLFDEDGMLIEWNKGEEQITGLKREEVIGRDGWEVMYELMPPEMRRDITPEYRAKMHSDFMTSLRERLTRSEPVEHTLHRKDGTIITTQALSFQIRVGENTIYASISRDITAAKQALEALQRSEEKFKLFVENFPGLLFVKDKETRFILVSKNYEKLYHTDLQNLLGKKNEELLPANRATMMTADDLSVLTLPPGEYREVIEEYPDEKGQLRTYSTYKFPIHRGQEEPLIGGITVDITERKRAEEALRASLSWNRAILEAIPDLIFIIDADGNLIDYKAEDPALLFYPPESFVGKNLLDIFPRDVSDAMLKTIRRALDTGKVQTLEYQFFIPTDDQMRHFEARISFSGVNQVLVLVRDITERKLYEQELQKARQELANQVAEMRSRSDAVTQLTQASNMLQLSMESEETYTIAKQYALKLFPGTSGALLMEDNQQGDLVVTAEWGMPALVSRKFNRNICWGIRRGRPYMINDINTGLLCGHIGSPVPASYICVSIMAQAQAIGLLYIQSDPEMPLLTEVQESLASAYAEQLGLAFSNIQLRARLREQAIRDPLTGLYNRYYMEESLSLELQRATRSGKPVGLIMMDLDHFKELNSVYGHPNVDAMLREFGELLRRKVRSGDIACRYGGDEFLLILPDSPLEVVTRRAEELRRHIQTITIRGKGLPVRQMSGSFGVAVFPLHGADVTRLLEVVDGALYQAKDKGGDCVVVVGQ